MALKSWRLSIVLALALFLVSSPAYANIVWPALVLEGRILIWQSILVGLLTEFFFVYRIFDLSPLTAIKSVLVANAVSTLAGIFLIPASGFILGIFVNSIFNFEAFGSTMWVATFIGACLVNTAIEALVYKYGFRLPVGWVRFLWLVAANALSVGVAAVSLHFDLPKY